jgi:hypothetical protein
VTPGVHLADALTRFLGWLLLATWVLIALAHRHPAGPLLLLAGAIELLTLFLLVPDVVGRRRPFAERGSTEKRYLGRLRPSANVHHDASRPTARNFPTLRRNT